MGNSYSMGQVGMGGFQASADVLSPLDTNTWLPSSANSAGVGVGRPPSSSFEEMVGSASASFLNPGVQEYVPNPMAAANVTPPLGVGPGQVKAAGGVVNGNGSS